MWKGHLKGAVNFPMEPTKWSEWRRDSALETFQGLDKVVTSLTGGLMGAMLQNPIVLNRSALLV